jgi:DNA-binding protein HU-beta
MQRSELIKLVSRQSGCSVAIVERIVKITFQNISSSIEQGEEVTLCGFGKFYYSNCIERTRKNIITGESFQVPAQKKVRFAPSSKSLQLIKQLKP